MTNRLDRAPAQSRLARNPYFSTSETSLRKREFASWNYFRCGGKPAQSHQMHFIGLQSKSQNVVFWRNVGVSKPQIVVFSRNVSLNDWTQRVCKTELWIHRASFLQEKLCASKRWTSLKPYFYEKSMTNRLDRAPPRAGLPGTRIFLLLRPLSENVNLLHEISSDVAVKPPRAIREALYRAPKQASKRGFLEKRRFKWLNSKGL